MTYVIADSLFCHLLLIYLRNIWSLINRKEYNIGRLVLLTSILYSDKKPQKLSNSVTGKNGNLLILNKLMTDY